MTKWLEELQVSYKWVNGHQPQVFQELQRTIAHLRGLVNETDWKMESRRVEITQQVKAAIDERRLIRPQSTF